MSEQRTARWQLRSVAPASVVFDVVRRHQVSPDVAHLLTVRGFAHHAEAVLGDDFTRAEAPSLTAAAERIYRAIMHRQRILVHGDYDADGITGSAILYRGLGALGANVATFIPNRLTDGYGINMTRVPEHAERADLLITVDCGISNAAEVAALQELGVEVIITDHHAAPDVLPDALLVHPAIDETSEFGVELTGAGVAFHLLWHVRALFHEADPHEFTDLAAIGTVADVAPLLGANRALVRRGVQQIARSSWPGIHALSRVAGVKSDVSARDIAFGLAPRINSSGRLGEGEVGLELLTTDSQTKAEQLAIYLDARNQTRRELQDRIYETALEMVDPAAPAIVLDHPEWHAGVIGIVASKLLERFYKPVYLAANGRGSVRSTPGISAVNGLRAAEAHLLGYGGHPQAAGFGMKPGAFDAFRDAIHTYVASHPTPVPMVELDAVLTRQSLSGALYTELAALEPFGEGFEAPRFAFAGRLEAARAVGAGLATLQVQIDGVRGVAWQKGHEAQQLTIGEPVVVATALQKNSWRGRSSVELLIDDIRPSERIAIAAKRASDAVEVQFSPVETLDARLAEVVRHGAEPRLVMADEAANDLAAHIARLPSLPQLRAQLRAALTGDPAEVDEQYREILTRLGFIRPDGSATRHGASPYTDEAFMAQLTERYRLESIWYARAVITPESLPHFLHQLYS